MEAYPRTVEQEQEQEMKGGFERERMLGKNPPDHRYIGDPPGQYRFSCFPPDLPTISLLSTLTFKTKHIFLAFNMPGLITNRDLENCYNPAVAVLARKVKTETVNLWMEILSNSFVAHPGSTARKSVCT